jgi:SPP1 family predicted phage head-tail adaptor
MTAAGDLDRRIVIERSTSVPDGGGGHITTWTEIADVAASRRDVSDTERVAYGGIVSELISRFVIRDGGPAATVLPSDRLNHEGQVWNIMGVKEALDGRNRFLEITAKVGG